LRDWHIWGKRACAKSCAKLFCEPHGAKASDHGASFFV
jgi:hypothetical protein